MCSAKSVINFTIAINIRIADPTPQHNKPSNIFTPVNGSSKLSKSSANSQRQNSILLSWTRSHSMHGIISIGIVVELHDILIGIV